MSRPEMYGKIQTVLGTIDPDSLGMTLTHEHLLCDASVYFNEPTDKILKTLAYQPINMENLGWLRQNPSNNLENLQLLDKEIAISELIRYKKAGGNSIVEMSNIGLKRDPIGLVGLSKTTGLNIIMGAGYYVGASHPENLSVKSVDTIADEIINDITIGVGNTGIRAGMLGEIGCSTPLQENECKVLRAVAAAQRITGVPVNLHPGNSDKAPFEVAELFLEYGGDISHTVISHVDNRIGDNNEKTVELAETGCYVEYDLFGQAQRPLSYEMLHSLSDWQRVEGIKQLIDQGFLDQLLISHDVFHKIAQRHYGGYGFDHIPINIVNLMRMKDITEKQIQAILVDNPKKMLRFKKVLE
jgi:phosphotriesterase-related protein